MERKEDGEWERGMEMRRRPVECDGDENTGLM